MKTFKKLFTAVIAIAMVIAMALPAMASDIPTTQNHTLTVDASTKGAGNTPLTEHTFNAYEIFTGVTKANNGMSVSDWGEGINGTSLIAAFKTGTYTNKANESVAISDSLKARFKDATSATEFAYLMGADANATPARAALTAAETAEMAKIMRAFITESKVALTESTSNPGKYTASVPDGYYLIVDDSAVANKENDVASANMLAVVEDVTVTFKGDVPKSQKGVTKVDPGAATGYENYPANPIQNVAHANIGDTVYYTLLGTTSEELSKFNKYYYAFVDQLSSGLTANVNSIKVYNKTTDITKHFTITATPDTGVGAKLEIKCADLKQIAGITGGDVLTVRYSAVLNSNAKVGGEGNENEMHVEYSNNPDTDDKGKTPDDDTTVFTLELDVTKTKDDGTTVLPGAEFSLYRINAEGKAEFAITDAGAEVTGSNPKQMLYTITGWTTPVENQGTPGGEAKYTTPDTASKWSTGPDGGTYQGIQIKGLEGSANGTKYYFREEKAPNGYNKLDNDQEWTIKAEGHYNDTTKKYELTNLEITSGTVKDNNISLGTVQETVVNTNDLILPTTGGIGTTIFYVLGAVLVLGAGILLVVRRRMNLG